MNDFPKMLYQAGDDIVWEGRKLATLIVTTAEHEAEAITEGWRSLETLLKAGVSAVEKKVKK